MPQDTERLREVLRMIATDAEADVHRFEGQPFTGKTVAEYMGCQAAAIASLAKVVEELLPDGDPRLTDVRWDTEALAEVARDPDWYIAQRGADLAMHRMDES